MDTVKRFIRAAARLWPLVLVIAVGSFMFGGVGFMVALSRLSVFATIILVLYFVIRSLFPYINMEKFSNKAAEDPLASALVFCIMIIFIISLCYITVAQADDLSEYRKAEQDTNIGFDVLEKATPFLPELKSVVQEQWADGPLTFYYPGLIEQESCDNKSKCWNPKVELKTHREYGFGLVQITIAYKKKGGVRFNNFEEAKKKYKELSEWKWEDRYNVRHNMTYVVLETKKDFATFSPFFKDDMNRWAAALVAYNAGAGTITERMAVCKSTEGCDTTAWFGGLDTVIMPYEKKFLYGRALSELRNSYPRNIIKARANKYLIPWGNDENEALPNADDIWKK